MDKLYSQKALDKAVADAYAKAIERVSWCNVAVHDQRSAGYMEAVEKIRASINELATGVPQPKL